MSIVGTRATGKSTLMFAMMRHAVDVLDKQVVYVSTVKSQAEHAARKLPRTHAHVYHASLDTPLSVVLSTVVRNHPDAMVFVDDVINFDAKETEKLSYTDTRIVISSQLSRLCKFSSRVLLSASESETRTNEVCTNTRLSYKTTSGYMHTAKMLSSLHKVSHAFVMLDEDGSGTPIRVSTPMLPPVLPSNPATVQDLPSTAAAPAADDSPPATQLHEIMALISEMAAVAERESPPATLHDIKTLLHELKSTVKRELHVIREQLSAIRTQGAPL